MSNLFGGRSGKGDGGKHSKALHNLLTKPLPGIGKIPPQDTPCRCTGCPTINDHPQGSTPDTPGPNDAIQGNVGGLVRTFDTGATRDVDHDKLDPEGFLSPLVIKAFSEYMHENRKQKDGSFRSSDNWQKGIPRDAYMKSGWRHFMDWWMEHRGYGSREGMVKALCGLMFNVMGYLHEVLKEAK